jgi:hypothetical protein
LSKITVTPTEEEEEKPDPKDEQIQNLNSKISEKERVNE